MQYAGATAERRDDPSGQSSVANALAGLALDLHEGIGDPRLCGGCQRWPEHLRLVNCATGELALGRCRATNLCPYCARLFAVETSEMLLLDAMEYAPTLYVVLTAREHLDHSHLKRHLTQLRRSLRKTWAGIEWAALREYQGRGALHVNLMVKGVPVEHVERFRRSLCNVWCSRADAEPVGQYVGVIADELGVVKYVTLHFMKESQAPGLGWRGHRFSCTRGYLVRPAAVMREEARTSLRLKRKLWRGVSLEVALAELEADAAIPWALVEVLHVGRSVEKLRHDAARRPFEVAAIVAASERDHSRGEGAAGARDSDGPGSRGVSTVPSGGRARMECR